MHSTDVPYCYRQRGLSVRLCDCVCVRELHGDGDHGFPARGNGDRVHGNTAGMGTNFTVIPWERGDLLR